MMSTAKFPKLSCFLHSESDQEQKLLPPSESLEGVFGRQDIAQLASVLWHSGACSDGCSDHDVEAETQSSKSFVDSSMFLG